MARSPDLVMSDPPEPPEVLASAIIKISESMERLIASGLNRKAIVILLSHSTGVAQREINKIIDALKDMKRDYCR